MWQSLPPWMPQTSTERCSAWRVVLSEMCQRSGRASTRIHSCQAEQSYSDCYCTCHRYSSKAERRRGWRRRWRYGFGTLEAKSIGIRRNEKQYALQVLALFCLVDFDVYRFQEKETVSAANECRAEVSSACYEGTSRCTLHCKNAQGTSPSAQLLGRFCNFRLDICTGILTTLFVLFNMVYIFTAYLVLFLMESDRSLAVVHK